MSTPQVLVIPRSKQPTRPAINRVTGVHERSEVEGLIERYLELAEAALKRHEHDRENESVPA